MSNATMAVIASPVGALELRVVDGHLTRIHFAGNAPLQEGTLDDDPVLRATADQLREYFAGERTTFDVPMRLEGTAFQRMVWQLLLEIPYGETWSYGQLAKRIGPSASPRAVGAANGSNPIPVIVPCHRVIGANGKLVGYGGGLDKKVGLLELEARVRVEADFG
ncbi:methylated-DNA--[protein]-cysteine S-methyltransferase [Tenggerimyces flavus]|uniref:Methylated-DNA--protein-cysteine methyltransferase n=1 Tax=Tenggerimyces flavus TaxID=1708749 RepID=A0ABV7Y9B3_9ACTN|nr:methylated-DNA--[protein]-cysteine S-methyltransferase [Tenggerimyces flavus]MBM7785390.1 methylated-DNA-[protein]-cysteine S-methyltransferase [Tenggerimyces flavus]